MQREAVHRRCGVPVHFCKPGSRVCSASLRFACAALRPGHGDRALRLDADPLLNRLRRRALVALSLSLSLSLLLLAFVPSTQAQDYPSRPITMVVPFTPGA